MYITCMHGMVDMYFLTPDKYNRTKLHPLVSFLSRRESIPTRQEFALARTSDAESLVSREPVKRLFWINYNRLTCKETITLRALTLF